MPYTYPPYMSGYGGQQPPYYMLNPPAPPPPPTDAAGETVTIEVASFALQKTQDPLLGVHSLERAWLDATAEIVVDHDTTTELLVVQASEHYIDGNGQSSVTLYSLKDQGESTAQLRWL